MKQQLRSVFSFILNILESGDESYHYRPSHRTALIVVGILFSALAGIVFWFSPGSHPGYILPVLVFSVIGIVCLVTGLLGTDRAVARIWGSR